MPVSAELGPGTFFLVVAHEVVGEVDVADGLKAGFGDIGGAFEGGVADLAEVEGLVEGGDGEDVVHDDADGQLTTLDGNVHGRGDGEHEMVDGLDDAADTVLHDDDGGGVGGELDVVVVFRVGEVEDDAGGGFGFLEGDVTGEVEGPRLGSGGDVIDDARVGARDLLGVRGHLLRVTITADVYRRNDYGGREDASGEEDDDFFQRSLLSGRCGAGFLELCREFLEFEIELLHVVSDVPG